MVKIFLLRPNISHTSVRNAKCGSLQVIDEVETALHKWAHFDTIVRKMMVIYIAPAISMSED
jgi:hypothetical protein